MKANYSLIKRCDIRHFRNEVENQEVQIRKVVALLLIGSWGHLQPTSSFNKIYGKDRRGPSKPYTYQHSMDPGDSKNVYGSPKLQRKNFTLKIQGCAKFLE